MIRARKQYFKYCMVPCCTNTTVTAPDKIFLSVPRHASVREAWTKAMKRDSKKPALSAKTPLWCCEDHFSLEDDMENYLRHRLSDSYTKIKLKPGVVPSFFECQKKDSLKHIQGKCSVPGCRGNHTQSNKAVVFEFPSDLFLRRKWLRAIPRKNFRITKNSRVCERHFKEDEVIRSSTFCLEMTGEKKTAPMRYPKLKENVVPSIFLNFPSSKRRKIPPKKTKRIKTELGTEFHAETSVPVEKSIVIKQEPEESVDEPSLPVIEEVISSEKLSSYSCTSLPNFNKPLVPVSANLSQTSATPISNTATKERKINQIELGANSIIPEKSVDKPPQVTDEQLLSSEKLLSSSSVLLSTYIIPPVYVLPIANPYSTYPNQILATHVSNTEIQNIKINKIELDANSVKTEKSVNEPPQLGVEKILPAEELSSSSTSSTTSNIPSVSRNVLLISNSDSASMNQTSATHVSNTETKRKINYVETDSSDHTRDANHAKSHQRAKPSVSLKRNCNLPQHSRTSKTSTQHSILSTKNEENAARDIFQSLFDGSKSDPLLGSRTARRPVDLFSVFSDFIADKLRNMDSDDCASAVKTILDVVFKVEHDKKDE